MALNRYDHSLTSNYHTSCRGYKHRRKHQQFVGVHKPLTINLKKHPTAYFFFRLSWSTFILGLKNKNKNCIFGRHLDSARVGSRVQMEQEHNKSDSPI